MDVVEHEQPVAAERVQRRGLRAQGRGQAREIDPAGCASPEPSPRAGAGHGAASWVRACARRSSSTSGSSSLGAQREPCDRAAPHPAPSRRAGSTCRSRQARRGGSRRPPRPRAGGAAAAGAQCGAPGVGGGSRSRRAGTPRRAEPGRPPRPGSRRPAPAGDRAGRSPRRANRLPGGARRLCGASGRASASRPPSLAVDGGRSSQAWPCSETLRKQARPVCRTRVRTTRSGLTRFGAIPVRPSPVVLAAGSRRAPRSRALCTRTRAARERKRSGGASRRGSPSTSTTSAARAASWKRAQARSWKPPASQQRRTRARRRRARTRDLEASRVRPVPRARDGRSRSSKRLLADQQRGRRRCARRRPGIVSPFSRGPRRRGGCGPGRPPSRRRPRRDSRTGAR